MRNGLLLISGALTTNLQCARNMNDATMQVQANVRTRLQNATAGIGEIQTITPTFQTTHTMLESRRKWG